MKVLYDIQDMLEDELKKISKKEDITTMDLDNIYKMVDIVKDVATVKAMQEGGYSQDYSRGSYGGSYGRGGSYNSYEGSYGRGSYDGSYEGSYGRRGRDGDGDGRYSEEGSYRRGRDSMGRYTSRDGSYGSYDGQSGHSKEQMLENLKELMRNARNEDEKESYRRALEQLSR